jgi:hypothetical protein
VLEVFVDERDAFASRIYPTLAESTGLAVLCEGGSAIVDSIRVSQVPAIKASTAALESKGLKPSPLHAS